VSGEKQLKQDSDMTTLASVGRTLRRLGAALGLVVGSVAVAGLIFAFLILLPGAVTWLSW
jgi:hypothetical protein